MKTGPTHSRLVKSYCAAAATLLACLGVLAGPGTALARGALGIPFSSATEPPTNTKLPTISGEAVAGGELTETPGEWSGAPTETKYEWLSCNAAGEACSPIAAPPNEPLRIEPTLEGQTIRAKETATNLYGEGTAESAQTEVVGGAHRLKDVSPPTVTGVAKLGETLTEHPGTWEGEVTGSTITWERCSPSPFECEPIPGAEGAEYTLVAADVGDEIVAMEQVSNVKEVGPTAMSAATEAVTASKLVNKTAPAVATIEGELRVGEEAAVTSGSWEPAPEQTSYAWELCDAAGGECAAIAGATSSHLALTAQDVGETLRVIETAGLKGAPNAESTSPQSPTVMASAAEEEAAAKRRAEEEAAAKKAQEEAAAKRKAEEEAAAKKAQEEAAAKRKAEEEAAAKKTQEEAAAKKKAEEEAAAKKKAEEREEPLDRAEFEERMTRALETVGIAAADSHYYNALLGEALYVSLVKKVAETHHSLSFTEVDFRAPEVLVRYKVTIYYQGGVTVGGVSIARRHARIAPVRLVRTKIVRRHGKRVGALVLTKAGKRLLRTHRFKSMKLRVVIGHGKKTAAVSLTLKVKRKRHHGGRRHHGGSRHHRGKRHHGGKRR